MSYQLNTKRKPFNIEAFQWDGNKNTSSWPDWAKKPAATVHIKVVKQQQILIIMSIGSIMIAKKGDWIVKYPSGHVAKFSATDFNYNFVKV